MRTVPRNINTRQRKDHCTCAGRNTPFVVALTERDFIRLGIRTASASRNELTSQVADTF
jgi:hypothetical protein